MTNTTRLAAVLASAVLAACGNGPGHDEVACEGYPITPNVPFACERACADFSALEMKSCPDMNVRGDGRACNWLAVFDGQPGCCVVDDPPGSLTIRWEECE